MSPRRLRKYPGTLTALLTVLLAVVWVIFAPGILGGQASYVIVNGNSMEPLYHPGDLVILRGSDRAEVGDIFTYWYPEVGAVIHRIVAREGDRFIMKGDHNSWTDGYHPKFDDLIGKAFVHLPGVGNTVKWLRKPSRFAGIVTIMAGLFIFGLVFDSSQKKGKTIKWPLLRFRFPKIPPSIAREREGYLFALSLLLFASIALGIYAFIAPLSRTEEDNIEYVNSVDYLYTALSNSIVYTEGIILSGEPVFTQLKCNLKIETDYAIQSAQPVAVSGSYNTGVVVSEPTGWKRTISLQPDTPFKDNAFKGSVILDICTIQKMIDAMTELTGLNRSYYNVSVVSEITATGKIGGRAYQEKFSPTLDFILDPTELYLVQADINDGSDPLRWKQAGTLLGERNVANDLSIFGMEIPVLTARIAAIIGLMISIAGIVLLTLPVYQEAKKDELAAIHLKYAPLLVQINQSQTKRRTASTKLIDIASMTDLARLAQNADQVILEQPVGDEHHFLVFSDPYTYRYILLAPKKEEPVLEPEENKDADAAEDTSVEDIGDAE
jgi:signal peptidase I